MQQQILRALLKKPHTFWQLIRKQDGHLARYVQLLKEMLDEGLIYTEKDSLYISDRGRKLAAESGLSPLQQVACPTCGGKTVVLAEKFTRVFEEFAEIARERPAAISEYDQGYVDPASTVARVAVMYERGDLEGRDIFLIGDDDLTGIAIALTGMARKVTVLEVDERLVNFINKVAGDKNLSNLSVHTFDVRRSLPEKFRGKYDTFLIDPVETLPGITLFLSRCAQSLKGEGCAGYFGLTHLEASRKKWHAIQQMILDMNFAITDIIHDFQEYELEREGFTAKDYPVVTKAFGQLPVPDVNWYTSNFCRIEAIDKPKVPEGEIPEGREFYFDDEAYATLPK